MCKCSAVSRQYEDEYYCSMKENAVKEKSKIWTIATLQVTGENRVHVKTLEAIDYCFILLSFSLLVGRKTGAARRYGVTEVCCTVQLIFI